MLRTGRRLHECFLSLSRPFCFSISRISQWKLGLEDSENVCSDCRWCCCVNINHKCKRRWGCVSFYYLPLFTAPPLLFLYPVFLTFPTFVVPVHSIRLEYGCVVVDTCTVWSVSQCCRVMICCSSWSPSNTEQWLDQWRQKMMKGVTQVPYWKKQTNKKTWFPFHALLIPEDPFLELSRSAQCHSGIFLWIWKPMDCTVCIFSDDILSHFNLHM